MSAADDEREPIQSILRFCVEGQITMLNALVDLVDREQRPALQARIASHRQLVERLLDPDWPGEATK